MKGLLWFWIFLICISGVLAMDDPVRVKTEPGYSVKVYAWTAGGGPLLTNANGVTDDNGIFETTFFSLNVPSVKYQVIVMRPSGAKIYDEKFDNWGTSKGIEIDCFGLNCSISYIEVEPETLVEDSNDTIDADTGVENEEVAGSFNSSDLNLENSISIGDIINKKHVAYFVFGFILLVVVAGITVVLILWLNGRGDQEERELKYIEKQIKKRKKEIDKIKVAKDRKKKIKEAKEELIEKNKELASLKKRQLNDAKAELGSEEKELENLKKKGKD